jgi:hypothetical protein
MSPSSISSSPAAVKQTWARSAWPYGTVSLILERRHGVVVEAEVELLAEQVKATGRRAA